MNECRQRPAAIDLSARSITYSTAPRSDYSFQLKPNAARRPDGGSMSKVVEEEEEEREEEMQLLS